MGDKVLIKTHRLKENEDGKLRPQYRGVYTINSFLSLSNVILTDDNGRQLSQSVYINNPKKYSDRKQFNIADDQLVQQNGLYNSQSEEDDSSLSDQSEYEDEIPQHSENDVNHEVVTSNQHQDNGDMNHNVEDSIHQQPLSVDSRIDHDGQEEECVDSDLPFSGLDDDSLIEEMKDISQQQGKPTIQNDEYHKVKKVYRKRKLSSGDIEYYLSWAYQPAKNLIIYIPQLKNQTNYFYFRPCQYVNDIQEDLFNAGIASNVSTILTQFTKVCKVFTKLKDINNKFKISYEEQIDKSLEAISLLTHASRDKRSLFSTLRHTLNIGSYNSTLE